MAQNYGNKLDVCALVVVVCDHGLIGVRSHFLMFREPMGSLLISGVGFSRGRTIVVGEGTTQGYPCVLKSWTPGQARGDNLRGGVTI
jgi:hypothetical protein